MSRAPDPLERRREGMAPPAPKDALTRYRNVTRFYSARVFPVLIIAGVIGFVVHSMVCHDRQMEWTIRNLWVKFGIGALGLWMGLNGIGIVWVIASDLRRDPNKKTFLSAQFAIAFLVAGLVLIYGLGCVLYLFFRS